MKNLHQTHNTQLAKLANDKAQVMASTRKQMDQIDAILTAITTESGEALSDFYLLPKSSTFVVHFRTFAQGHIDLLSAFVKILGAPCVDSDDADSGIFWVHGPNLTVMVEYPPAINRQLVLGSTTEGW